MAKKILIVDDDKYLLEAISFMLSTEGYILKTSSGTTVVEDAIVFKPHFILLDILLSGMDGRLICKKIKQHKQLNGIPVVLLSAHPATGKNYKRYQADSFLAKPFDNEQLLELINKFIK